MLFRHIIFALPVLFIVGSCKEKKSSPILGLKNPLSVERLYASPKLSGDFPKSLKTSPDGSKITFLKGKKDNFSVLDLWEFDLKTGKPRLLVDSKKIMGEAEEKVSDEERARRERKRIRESGIVEYQWSQQGDKLLFPIGGDIYIYHLGGNESVKRVTETDAYEIDPRFSPQGNFVSFVRDHNVYVVDLNSMEEKKVSSQGTEEKPMGVAEFVAQEEMARYRGYWWSPNEKYIAIAQVDNEPVKNIKRFEVYSDKLSVIEQKYPKAGAENAIVKLGIFDLKKSKPQWIPIKGKDYYIPQVKWLPNKESSTLSYTVQSRDQKLLDFWTYSIKSKKHKKVFSEKDTAWVNIRHDYKFLKQDPKLLWVSEKSGFNHLHLFDLNTGEERALTSGPWEVTKLHAVDEKSGVIFFSATKDSALESHLYRVSLIQDVDPVRVTKEDGYHRIVMGKKTPFFLSYFSTPETPPSLGLYDLSGERKFYIEENKVAGEHPMAPFVPEFGQWEFGTHKLKDGTELFYKILKPKNFNKNKKYPVIQYVYGGPGVQLVTKAWSRQNLFQQLLVQKGFIVVVADNRGTPHRGRNFERSYYLKFGQQEVTDQSTVLSYLLKKNSYMDKERVGAFGHSYGGYLTLMLLFQKADIYHVGVSGAPVTDWTFYDTHYTERYMGKPQDNKELYDKSNVINYVEGYKGRVLVVHGMADDNVLYNHSLILYQKLQEQGKMFDIMAYPGAKHGIRRKKAWSIHYFRSILSYFNDHLLKEL